MVNTAVLGCEQFLSHVFVVGFCFFGLRQGIQDAKGTVPAAGSVDVEKKDAEQKEADLDVDFSSTGMLLQKPEEDLYEKALDEAVARHTDCVHVYQNVQDALNNMRPRIFSSWRVIFLVDTYTSRVSVTQAGAVFIVTT